MFEKIMEKVNRLISYYNEDYFALGKNGANEAFFTGIVEVSSSSSSG